MSIYVFLGPTLPVARARQILDAVYLPPVALGGVYALVERRPTGIAIVDGVFETTPSVWHKEILYAMSRGVPVFGASSMGALRAAELCAFGMRGSGRIFEAYRDGVLEDDDEVAVEHASAEYGYRQISEAMVNIRFGIETARERRLIAAGTADVLLAEAKGMFYPDRSWPAIRRAGLRRGLPGDELSSLMRYIEEEQPNLKQADAIELLEQLAHWDGAPHRPDFHFEETRYWKALRQYQLSLGSEPCA